MATDSTETSARAPITIAALLAEASRLDSGSALLDAQLLLCQVLRCNRAYLYTWPEKPVTAGQALEYSALLEQRARGVPVAHLLEDYARRLAALRALIEAGEHTRLQQGLVI